MENEEDVRLQQTVKTELANIKIRRREKKVT